MSRETIHNFSKVEAKQAEDDSKENRRAVGTRGSLQPALQAGGDSPCSAVCAMRATGGVSASATRRPTTGRPGFQDCASEPHKAHRLNHLGTFSQWQRKCHSSL